jgi:hypothetical protein
MAEERTSKKETIPIFVAPLEWSNAQPTSPPERGLAYVPSCPWREDPRRGRSQGRSQGGKIPGEDPRDGEDPRGEDPRGKIPGRSQKEDPRDGRSQGQPACFLFLKHPKTVSLDSHLRR